MPKLKSRTQQIPGGFSFIEPSTGWKSPPWASFEVIVQSLIEHRKGNIWNTHKHRLPTEYKAVADEVDNYNAAVCLSHGWTDYLMSEAVSFPKSQPSWRLLQGAAAAIGGVKRTVAGIKVVKDWLGSGLKPVPHELSEKRASVCAACPLNQDANFWQKIDAKAAAEVKSLVSVKNDMDLKTSFDPKLKSCQACDCWLELKVHTPLSHIKDNTSKDIMAKLDKGCWILSEK